LGRRKGLEEEEKMIGKIGIGSEGG